MLKFMRIERFKSLYDAQFPLGKLNIFSGLNGMGKSSFIQTLLLLRQSWEQNTLQEKGLLLQGNYLSLGTGQDVLSENANDENISFIMTWENMDPCQVQFKYIDSSDLLPFSLEHSIPDQMYSKSLFTNQFQYLSADRISPKSSYEISNYHIDNLNSIGNHGEYTPHYIALYGAKDIHIKALKHAKAVNLQLHENLEKWLAEVSPGIKIKTEIHRGMNVVSLNYAFQQGKEITSNFKPQNVGFGLTFILPVLTAILRAKHGDMLIIENPEAHLHPAGQAIIGRLCSIAAQNGVQFFIETHSDHFFNGVRVSVKTELIRAEDVRIFFLERDAESEEGTTVVSPSIDEYGRINCWPKGFFDEIDVQLEKLL